MVFVIRYDYKLMSWTNILFLLVSSHTKILVTKNLS